MRRNGFVAAVLLAMGAVVSDAQVKSFADDVAFLTKYTDAVVLKGEGGCAVAVVPKYQGRVMTSTVDMAKGEGFGWINYNLVKSRKYVAHFNPLGGEDRFWLGPEGGQFSIFFKDFSPFDLDHWQTPAPIDTDPYKIVAKSASSVTFEHTFSLENYSGTKFRVGLRREVSVLSKKQALEALAVKEQGGVDMVAYQSSNTVTNKGSATWDEMNGMLSIWILGMFKPTDKTTIIAPYDSSSEGTVVNDTYFGKVPADRLKIESDYLMFRGDGKMRTKIGLPPNRAKDVIGSYDSKNHVLTIVKFTFDKSADKYVNSMWELQDKPFGGDVSNSYNDGPPKPGVKPLGPFYELESSSAAMALEPGAKHTHVSQTFHFVGSHDALNQISMAVLGADLDYVAKAF